MLTDAHGHLTGIFTDSDLARLFESRRDASIDQPVRAVMSPHPTTVGHHAIIGQAIDVFARCKISELPVVDEDRRPCGLIDITDVVELLPRDELMPLGSTQSARLVPFTTDLDVVLPFPNQPPGSPRR